MPHTVGHLLMLKIIGLYTNDISCDFWTGPMELFTVMEVTVNNSIVVLQKTMEE